MEIKITVGLGEKDNTQSYTNEDKTKYTNIDATFMPYGRWTNLEVDGKMIRFQTSDLVSCLRAFGYDVRSYK
jgi:hypothetical protein